MDPQTATDKLRILLPHWISHNRSHAAEFRTWAAAARKQGAEDLAGLLDRAADSVAAAVDVLGSAGALGGGPVEEHGHAHPHDHPHAPESVSSSREHAS